jgi:hypothetical protein
MFSLFAEFLDSMDLRVSLSQLFQEWKKKPHERPGAIS